MGRAEELGGGNVRGGNSLLFKVDDVVRTARDAAPSIAQGFDERVTLLPQLRFEWLGGGPRHRRFHPAQDVLHPVPLTQHLFHAIEEERALGLANVQQSNRLPGQGIQPGLYTLRYELVPNDGNHLGVANSRDFGLLVRAADDPDPARR